MAHPSAGHLAIRLWLWRCLVLQNNSPVVCVCLILSASHRTTTRTGDGRRTIGTEVSDAAFSKTHDIKNTPEHRPIRDTACPALLSAGSSPIHPSTLPSQTSLLVSAVSLIPNPDSCKTIGRRWCRRWVNGKERYVERCRDEAKPEF